MVTIHRRRVAARFPAGPAFRRWWGWRSTACKVTYPSRCPAIAGPVRRQLNGLIPAGVFCRRQIAALAFVALVLINELSERPKRPQ